ncbi:MAG: hypothetical protein JW936_01075 [Sedimentisphaerales bacterium]|nr:hypothetical protein [Sedimentisphaerales bacterium]
MSISTKVRLALIVTIVGVLFGVLGWRVAAPQGPGAFFTVFGHAQPLMLAGLVVGLAAAATLVGGLLGGKGLHRMALAGFAAPAGFAFWAMFSNNMRIAALMNNTAESRSAMFQGLIGDTIFLGIVVVLAYLTANWWAQRGGAPIAKEDTFKSELRNWQQGLLGLGVSAGAAIVILLFTARSGTALIRTGVVGCPVKTGQAVFACIVAFYLAVVLARQLVEAGLLWLLLGPIIVAIIAYLSASVGGLGFVEGGEVVGPAVQGWGSWATVLPIQYIGFGCLGVMGGYWSSRGGELSKAAQLVAGVE